MRRDLAYLEDIVEASDAIAEFIRDQDMESFLSSPMLKSALAHQFTGNRRGCRTCGRQPAQSHAISMIPH